MAHLLCIEDDEEVVAFTRSVLQQHGYSLEVAGDGETGLQAYMTRRPDLILLDVFVPRLDGLRFARAVRERFPADRTPVVVWTGAYEPERIGDLLGTPHVLPKPTSSDALLEVVRRALGAETRPRALRVLAVSGAIPTLRAIVGELRAEFDVHTASSWEEALALLDVRTFEGVVVDLDGLGDDGASLLRAVASRHREVGRVVLAGPLRAEAARQLEASGAAESTVFPGHPPGALGDRLHAILG